jgi:hypothetical protein
MINIINYYYIEYILMERQLPDTISGINAEIYRDRTLIGVLQNDIARYERIISRLATENVFNGNAQYLTHNDNINNGSDFELNDSPYFGRIRNQNYYSDKIADANARILSHQERLERLIRHLDAMRLNQGSPHPDQRLPNRLGGSGSGKKKSKRKRSKSKSKTRKVKKGKGKTFKK